MRANRRILMKRWNRVVNESDTVRYGTGNRWTDYVTQVAKSMR